MSEDVDCCVGEEFNGDPHGLHSFDCPVYQRTAAAMEQIFGAGVRPSPRTSRLTAEQLVANTELRLAIAFIRGEYQGGPEVDAYKAWLIDNLADGEHRTRKGRRR